MTRNWQSGRDVRGAHVYLEISDDVRLIRRDSGYSVMAWDTLAEQWAPVPVDEPKHTGTLAIAAAKRYAKSLGQETVGVR